MKALEKNMVYYVESPTDHTVLIAMDVAIEREEKDGEIVYVVNWYDTNRMRGMTTLKIEQKDDGGFSFKRIEGLKDREYSFVPMNLEIYNTKVRPELFNAPEFASNEELTKFFSSVAQKEV